jgi:hypothetical protein
MEKALMRRRKLPPIAVKPNGCRPRFIPLQVHILEILKDGESHFIDDIMRELSERMDYQHDRRTVSAYISTVREKLETAGETIMCEIRNRRIFYRHVVLLTAIPLEHRAYISMV